MEVQEICWCENGKSIEGKNSLKGAEVIKQKRTGKWPNLIPWLKVTNNVLTCFNWGHSVIPKRSPEVPDLLVVMFFWDKPWRSLKSYQPDHVCTIEPWLPLKNFFPVTTENHLIQSSLGIFGILPSLPQTTSWRKDTAHVIRNLPRPNWGPTLFHHHLGPEWRRSDDVGQWWNRVRREVILGTSLIGKA